jgi:hypothetical protein
VLVLKEPVMLLPPPPGDLEGPAGTGQGRGPVLVSVIPVVRGRVRYSV